MIRCKYVRPSFGALLRFGKLLEALKAACINIEFLYRGKAFKIPSGNSAGMLKHIFQVRRPCA